jgi:hypothetical protein
LLSLLDVKIPPLLGSVSADTFDLAVDRGLSTCHTNATACILPVHVDKVLLNTFIEVIVYFIAGIVLEWNYRSQGFSCA